MTIMDNACLREFKLAKSMMVSSTEAITIIISNKDFG